MSEWSKEAMHRIDKATDGPVMATVRARVGALLLVGAGLTFLLPAHAAAASVPPLTTPVTLPTPPDAPTADLPPVSTTVPAVSVSVPVTVPSLDGVTTIPVLGGPTSSGPSAPQPTDAPGAASTPTPPSASDDVSSAPAVTGPGSSVDGKVVPPRPPREVPLSFTSAVRKAGPPFALPILVIVVLSAYQLTRAARDRRDHRLAAAVAEEQWVGFR
jgi:hypothetical protein